MSEGLVLLPQQGPPADSVEGTVCPLRSSTVLHESREGGMTKLSLDVTCRRSCMLYLDDNGKPRCSIALLAMAMAERA